LLAVLASLCSLSASLPLHARTIEWRPVGPAEINQKKPKLDPAADAEALFWEVYIEDVARGGDAQSIRTHYIRIKVFTEKGKEDQATVEIPRFGKTNISEVAGRTIKPDGTVIDLKKDSIFDRELVKTKGLKLRGKSFAMPNVEVGDIVEYRWKETRDNELVSYMRLHMQRDMPMWQVTYHVKPLQHEAFPYGMRSMAFQCEHPPFVREPDGFFAVTMSNVPAFRTEPNMPPEDAVKSWMLIYYEEDRKLDVQKFWREIGKQDFQRYKPLTKPDNNVKATALEVTSAASTPEEKLQLLDLYCRTKIKNTSSRASQLTAEERKALKENKNPGDTLKQRAGTGLDVLLLFASMAQSLGMDARIARVPDRSDTYFHPGRLTTYFMRNLDVAVNLDQKWRFYDPTTPYLEPGRLRWQEEGQQALVSDPKEGLFTQTQHSEPSASLKSRKGKFKLLEDGTLEGEVTYRYTGHVAVEQRVRLDDMSPAQREEDWKETLVARLSTAQMSDFKIENSDQWDKPFTVSHKLSIPGYAIRTGKRILLEPAFFERNYTARFVDTTRKYDVHFPYGWGERDEIEIELPEGWELDNPTAPAPLQIGETGKFEVKLRRAADGRKIYLERNLDFGFGMRLAFPVSVYPALKRLFEQMHTDDNHVLTLKQVAVNGSK